MVKKKRMLPVYILHTPHAGCFKKKMSPKSSKIMEMLSSTLIKRNLKGLEKYVSFSRSCIYWEIDSGAVYSDETNNIRGDCSI